MINKTFRLFISSTFSDFVTERDILNDKIFPVVDDFCQQRGYNFQLVDLRWGVTNESALNQNTLAICLDEVKRCRSLSPRPNFLLMMGERYGWIPIPTSISVEDFQNILSVASSEESAVLNQWYILDENAIGGEYYLKSRYGEYVNDALWGSVESEIRCALHNCIVNKLNADEKKVKEITTSATEREIFEGLLDYEGVSNNTIALFRKNYYEKDKEQGKIENLKNRIIQKMSADGCDSNIISLDYESESYSQDFADTIIKALKENISSEIERLSVEKKETEPKEELKSILDSAGVVFERVNETEKLYEYLNGESRKPLYLYGDSGSGKTTLLAQFVRNNNVKTFFSFYGLDDKSYALLSSVQKIVNEIKENYKIQKDFNVDEFNISEALYEALYSIPENEKALIVFDGFDMFHDISEIKERVIPTILPSNVKVIISSADIDIIRRFCDDNTQVLKLDWFSFDESKELFDLLLESKNRCISTEAQRKIVEATICGGATPLQLKLITEECLTWRSSDMVDMFPENVDDIAKRHILNMHLKFGHNKELVLYALALISAAPYGITEEELQMLLLRFESVRKYFMSEDRYDYNKEKLPFAVWSRLFYDLKGCLTLSRVKGLIVVKFAHQVFYRVFLKEYESYYNEATDVLISSYDNQSCYANDEKAPNVRKALAFAELLKRTADYQKLVETLADLKYVDSVIKIGNADKLMGDVKYALTKNLDYAHNELVEIYNCVQKNREMLNCYYGEFYTCVGNHPDLCDVSTEISVEKSYENDKLFYFPYSVNSQISWDYDTLRYAVFDKSYVYINDLDFVGEICRIYLEPEDGKKLNAKKVLWLNETAIAVITAEKSVLVYDFSDGIPNVVFFYQADNNFFDVEYSRKTALLYVRDWMTIHAFDVYANKERFKISLGSKAFSVIDMSYHIVDEENCLYIRDFKKYVSAYDLSTGEIKQGIRVGKPKLFQGVNMCSVHRVIEKYFLLYDANNKNKFVVNDVVSKRYGFLHPPRFEAIRDLVLGERLAILVYEDALLLVELENEFSMWWLSMPAVNNVSWIEKDNYFSVLTNDGLKVVSVNAFSLFDSFPSVCYQYKKDLFSSVFLMYRKTSRDVGALKKGLKMLAHMNNLWDYEIVFGVKDNLKFADATSVSASIVAVADDGKMAMAYEESNTIVVYNADKKPILRVDKLRFSVLNNLLKMCFSPDSKYLLLWRNNSVQVIDVEQGKKYELDLLNRPALDVNFGEGADTLKILLCDGKEYCCEVAFRKKASKKVLPKKVDETLSDNCYGVCSYYRNGEGAVEIVPYLDFSTFDIEGNVNNWFNKKRVYHSENSFLYYEDGEFFLNGNKNQKFSHEFFDFKKCYQMQKLKESKAIKNYLLEKNDLSSSLFEHGKHLVLVSRVLGSVIVFDTEAMAVNSAYKPQGNIVGCVADIENGIIELILDRAPYSTTVSLNL